MAVVSTGQITITDVNDYTYQGTTAPQNPIPNVTVWIDTSVSPSVMKRWTGTAWEIVNDVQVGGENLILGTKELVGTNSSFKTTERYDGLLVAKSYNDGTGYRDTITAESKVLNGTKFVLSFYAKSDKTVNVDCHFYNPNSAVRTETSTGQIATSVVDGRAQVTLIGDNTWRRYWVKISSATTITTKKSIIVCRNLNTTVMATVYACGVKLEAGNIPTDWTPAPEDIDSAILAAQNSANAANNLLADIANDNLLTPLEKQSTKKEWDIIVGEKSVVESQANSLGVSTTSYVNAYNSLNSYITPLLANLTVNSAIVGSDFRTTFKNYYDTKIALLKAVTDKLKYNTDNIQVGGRNLITKLPKEKSYPTTAFWEYFPLSEKLKEGETYILNGNVENVGGVITIGLNNLNGINNYFINLPINTPFVANYEMANRTHFSISNQTGVGTSIFKRFKLEKGNKATDWTPAPEDIDEKISAEAQKVINLENKTDFLTGTTIEGNAIATGTLLVGNSDGTNAGITGLGNTSDGVYLWGGGTYQQMLQGLAKKEQRRNGIDIWRHPNGQIGFEIGIKDGRLIFNGYHSNGFKLFELDPNRGLVNVSYTQESWTETPFRKLTYSSSTYNEYTITNELKSAITKESRWQNYSSPQHTVGPEFIINPDYIDADYGYITTYTLTQNAVGYDYDNGTNPGNGSYESLKGMKANYGDRNTNISNGWYAPNVGLIYSGGEFNNSPPPTYTFPVYIYYYQNGKITQTQVVTITK